MTTASGIRPSSRCWRGFKENLYESGSADSYNVCEWASIDRLEQGMRGGNIAALRASVAAASNPHL